LHCSIGVYGSQVVIIPPVATQVISAYGWRTSCAILGIINLVLVIVVGQFLRRDPGQTKRLPEGEGGVNQESLVSGAEGYSYQEVIRTRQFWIFCATYFCHGFFVQTIIVHIVPHAIDLGISAILAANILSVIGGLSIVGRIGMGSVGDRIGNKAALVIVFILMSVGLFQLLGAKELWMFYLFAVIFGFAYGGLIALQSPITAELFGLREHGVILGMVIFTVTIGGALGPLLVGRIFDITNSYQLGFLICAAFSVAGFILASVLMSSVGKV